MLKPFSSSTLKSLLTLVLVLSIVLVSGAAFAQQQQPQPTAGQLLKALSAEYKATFFRHRMTGIVLHDKNMQLEIAKKLATTPQEDFGTLEVIVVRDYLRSISTLQNIDANQYLGEKMPLLVKGLFGRTNGIYTQKLEDLTEKISTLVTISLLKNDTKAIDEFIGYMKKQTGIAGASFSGLLNQVLSSMKFQANSNQALANAYFKETVKTIESLVSAAKKTSLDNFDAKTAASLAKMNYKRLWRLVSATILVDIADIPSEIERIGKIDVNKASAADLVKIPGVKEDIAQKILKFRDERKVITSIHELDAIDGIGPKMVRKLKTALFAGSFTMPEKEWTVLCFINGDNNLELASLLGVNVMERVGSTENMNVVVQIDRISREQLGEDGDSDAMLDGNWSTARRYFVQKDARPFELNSILLEKMGEADMGSQKNFVEFCKYGMTHFPAKHYVVLISNHGSEFGIGGISFDDQSGNHMDTIQVGQALSEVRDAIKAQNGNDLIDLMVFDCCLLAKIEVLKEIAEYVHGLYACENVQINWYAYDDFLRALNAKPDVDGAALAKVYHKSYVDFMRNWARQKGQADKMVLTSTSFDMTKFGKFDEAFKKFSQVLNNYADTNLEAVQTVLGSLSPITDVTVFDLIDFVKKIQVAAKDDKEMAKACKEVLDAYGAPTKKVNLKEFNLVPYPSSSFILQESHNYLEATGNGLSIGVFTKPSWLKIAAGHPEWGLNDASLGNFLNKFKAGNYKDLKFSQETEWDEFLYKMIDKN